MAKCKKCNNTGIIDTGNDDLPCDCDAGTSAQFNIAGVDGSVTGREVRMFFLNSSPFKMSTGKKNILAKSLPTRTTWN